MQVKRPHFLLIERRERAQFSLNSLLTGGAGVIRRDQWVALAPHLGVDAVIEFDDLAVFDALVAADPVDHDMLVARFGPARISALLDAGLLIGDHPAHAGHRQRDQQLRDTAWWAPAAVMQSFGRWRGVDVCSEATSLARPSVQRMLELHGPPLPETHALRPSSTWTTLPDPARSTLDELLEARTTCRNFDRDHALPLADLATMLRRVFGVQARLELAPGVVAVKKNCASGGGLHPVEAYLLVQRVAGLPAGAYHYQAAAHALEPMLQPADVSALASELVAGQSWFADAPVLILLAARFQRTFWKYRNHPKAWKVIQLDAGHLSQNLYLSATELGYGAFITAAINDECAERCFELDGLATGAVAICGFGRRAATASNVELDPLGKALH